MDKRTLILDALLDLIQADKGASSTISDIAKQAGIAKGGIYYYFSSKEEIMDALVERSYGQVIDHCQLTIEHADLPALPKLALLFRSYYASSVEHSLDHYLHESQNAYSHQQSLVFLLTRLTPIVTSIIEQGVAEGVFTTSFPREVAEIVLADLCFVFDQGLFAWSKEDLARKLEALADFLEKVLSAPKDSFAFLRHFPLLE